MDDRSVYLQLCEVTEKKKQIQPQLYRGSYAGLIVFDISDPDSSIAVEDWYLDFSQTVPNVPIVLLGITLESEAITIGQG